MDLFLYTAKNGPFAFFKVSFFLLITLSFFMISILRYFYNGKIIIWVNTFEIH